MSCVLIGRFLVIGGKGSVGKAVVDDIVRAGGTVLTVSRSEGGADHLVGDIRSPDTLRAIADRGPFSGLVFAQRNRDSDDWLSQVDAMLAGPVGLIEALAGAGMLRGAAVVFISSNAADNAVPRVSLPYSATRGAINSVVRQLAYNYAGQGLRFNAVSFTTILKPGRGGNSTTVDPTVRQRFERTARATPSGRLATTADVAGVVGFLLSARSEMINGQCLVVDGGLSAISPEAAIEGGS
jgi:3-oxoacyl-[acyl-carrier protein] reductase